MTLVVLIVPLPAFLLDTFLAANLAIAILLLLTTLNAKRPLDVSVFPTLLLLMTLYRLALNVATTRLILLDGGAGKIVDAFGNLVVGGNLIVGCVVFLILVAIQFIVITKGATRISEVNARFTLDSLPGKQMAIDAELNVGAIDEKEAKQRRADLAAESEFFGAMDGASKYVRGDAIAGLVIMAVNVIGGVLLGVSNGQAIGDAVQLYTILTIGDGLSSQVPALMIAASAGVLVTKSSTDSNLGDEIGQQMVQGYRAMYTGSFVLLCLALVPGLPKLPFIGLAAIIFFATQRAKANATREADASEVTAQPESPEKQPAPDEQNLSNFLQHDRIVIEIGVGLINLVEPKAGKSIVDRIATLRKDLGTKFGFWIPKVRVHDNMKFNVLEYRIKIGGRNVGKGELQPQEYLAISSGNAPLDIAGRDTMDPAFGLPAKWITEANRRTAEISGYTVVDAATVLTTHLGECLKRHAGELLSREDLQKMLDKLAESAPTIVGEVKPDGLKAGKLHQVLVRLLRESVSISALERIVESCVHHYQHAPSVAALTEHVRSDIGPIIVEKFRADNGRVCVILLEPKLEQQLRQSSNDEMIVMQPDELGNLVDKVKSIWELTSVQHGTAALLVDSSLRLPLRQTVYRSLPQVSLISYSEIPHDHLIEPVSVIRHDDVFKSESQPASHLAHSNLVNQEQLV